ncbi:hypothetical protein FRB95_003062 [Tulasnella sp. JGI-2019a]|nr:hypothetical protein FRB95_003062 [Tulasnella sp. JGI-2019a]
MERSSVVFPLRIATQHTSLSFPYFQETPSGCPQFDDLPMLSATFQGRPMMSNPLMAGCPDLHICINRLIKRVADPMASQLADFGSFKEPVHENNVDDASPSSTFDLGLASFNHVS